MNEAQIKQHIQLLIEEYTRKAHNQSALAEICVKTSDQDYHHWLAVIAGAQAKALKRLQDEIEHPHVEA